MFFCKMKIFWHPGSHTLHALFANGKGCKYHISLCKMGCTSRALVLVYVCTLITRSRSNNKYLAPPRPWPPQITASCSKQEITSSLGSDQNIHWSSPQYCLLGTKTFPRTCVVARREPNQTSPLPKYGVKSGGFSWKGKLKRHSSYNLLNFFSMKHYFWLQACKKTLLSPSSEDEELPQWFDSFVGWAGKQRIKRPKCHLVNSSSLHKQWGDSHEPLNLSAWWWRRTRGRRRWTKGMYEAPFTVDQGRAALAGEENQLLVEKILKRIHKQDLRSSVLLKSATYFH